MGDVVSTSVQYQYTNVILFREVFGNWQEFNKHLNEGPEAMKDYLLNGWNKTREMLKNNANLLVKDLDREVTRDEFDVTLNKTEKGSFVFYFTFPDYAYDDAASKYVALALIEGMPRYITLEYSGLPSFLKEQLPDMPGMNEKHWVIGEFAIDMQTGAVKHINHGSVDNDRLTYFSTKVLGLLNSAGQ